MCFRPAAIEQPNICPHCETPNPPTSKKCRECGEKLEHVIADNQDLNNDGAPMPQAPAPASAAPTSPTTPKTPPPPRAAPPKSS